MPKQAKLPIEAYIAETGGDRRATYERNMRSKGNKRLGVWAPQAVEAELRDLCVCLVHSADAASYRDQLRILAASIRDQNALDAEVPSQ